MLFLTSIIFFFLRCFDIGPLRPAISIKDELEKNNRSFRLEPYVTFLVLVVYLSFSYVAYPFPWIHCDLETDRSSAVKFSTTRFVLLTRVLLCASGSSAWVPCSPTDFHSHVQMNFFPHNRPRLAVYTVYTRLVP